MKNKKKIRCIIAACLVAACLLAAPALIARLIDQNAVREKIVRAFGKATGGSISFDRMEISVFPRPGVMFERVRLDIPGRVTGSVSSLSAVPKIIPLLGGKVEINEVRLDKPDFTVILPPPDDKEETSLASLQKKLIELSGKASGLAASASEGSVRLKIEGEEIGITGFDAKVSVRADGISAKLDAAASFAEKISLKADIRPADFRGAGELRLSGFKLHKVPRKLIPGVHALIRHAEGDISLTYKAAGISDVRIEAEGSIPTLRLHREGGSAELKIKEFVIAAALQDRTTTATVKTLKLEQPGMALSAELVLDQAAPKASLTIKGSDFEVGQIRETALGFAGDLKLIENIFKYVEGGKIPRISFVSSGATIADLGRTANFRIEGRLNNGTIYIPKPDLRLSDVSADTVIEQGILTAKGVKSAKGTIRGTEGSVRVGLKGKDAPLHIETTVRADAAEVLGLLKQLIRNEKVLTELARVSSMSGSLGGRLVLGEQVNAVDITADVTEMKFSAEYNRLPSALSVAGGRLHYDRTLISTDELRGSIGKTSFANLTGQVRMGDEPRLEVRNAAGSVDLGRVFPWLLSAGGSESFLRKFKSMEGRLDIASVSIGGPLQKPEHWAFRAAATPKSVVLNAEGLSSEAGLDGGTIQATGDRLDFSNVSVQLLDASFRIAGSVSDYLRDLSRIEVSGEGTAGSRATEWTFANLKLSDKLKPQAKVSFRNTRAVWEKSGKTAFRSMVSTSAGLEMDLHIETGPELFSVAASRVRDPWSDASFSFRTSGREVAAGFKGRLSQKTLAPLFVVAVPDGAVLEGEFSARFPMDDPSGGTVQGSIRGEQLPVKMSGIDKIDRIVLQANGSEIRVSPAELSYAGNAFKVSGTLGVVKGAPRLDLDISSDSIVWEEIMKQTDTEKGAPGQQGKKPLQVQGEVRLKTGKFAYRGRDLTSVDAVIRPAGDVTRITIRKAGFCDIGVSGELEFFPGGTELDITLEAKEQEFKPTVVCLSRSRGDASGTFSLQARFKGRGAGSELKKAMNGSVMFSARDGRITKYRTLDSVFDFINSEEQLKGQVPDLDKKDLEYRLLMLRGDVDKGVLLLHEGVLDSGSVEIVAQGSVDLGEGALDLNLLVAPLRHLNKAVGSIPVVGTVLGGSLISVPVKVSGTVTEPKVNYLSATATVSNLTGMMSRTLKLPLNIFSPFTPKGKDKAAEQAP